MNINVVNFKDVLKKATLNFSIPSVQLKFEGGKISSSMISENRDAIVNIDVDNDVMDGDDVEFNFASPSQNLVPFLGLLDEDDADITIRNEKIILKHGSQKCNVHFCSPTIVNTFGGKAGREDIEYFVTMNINETFVENFNKIKKVGSRFGKVYLTVKDKQLFIETTDKTNRFSNSLKFKLMDIDMDKDFTMCFDYSNFSNLMNIVGNREVFKLNIAYIEAQEAGMLYVETDDKSENYYLMSREEAFTS